MQWASLWSNFSEPITTLKLDFACQISNGFAVDLLIYYHIEKHTKLRFFFSFLFFCFLQKRESYVLPCSISNNENKGYLKLERYQLGNYDYICLRQHINVAYVWQIYCRKLSHLWLRGEIILVAISIYNRLQDKDEMSGYTNFATVRYYFEARVLTGYKACIFYFVLCLRLCLHRSRVLVK